MTRNHARGGDRVRVARSQRLRHSAADTRPTLVCRLSRATPLSPVSQAVSR